MSAASAPTSARTLGYRVIVAMSASGGIGAGGKIPWSLPADLRHFSRVTRGEALFPPRPRAEPRGDMRDPARRNAVIMGRRTWESLPASHRPLPGRLNVVLTRGDAGAIVASAGEGGGALVRTAAGLEEAMALCEAEEGPEVADVYVIGGGQVYAEALSDEQAHRCDAVIVSVVSDKVLRGGGDGGGEGSSAPVFDTHFPQLDRAVWGCRPDYVENYPAEGFIVEYYERKARHPEWQYLDLVRGIIETGSERVDRTGVGTVAKFGATMRFDIAKDGFPLLTTKRVFWRGVAEELLWFVRGCTDAQKLADKGVHIWDGNGSREYLDSIGLTERRAMDLGPVYGFQWRHFGAEYTDCDADYTGQGYDQLAEVVDKIRNKPHDRRIIMSAWNPPHHREMALPPCHVMCQFFVDGGRLSCAMYQRSVDTGCGLPFNIASYSLLTCMLASVTGLTPGEFVINMGDTHVYKNHIDALKVQLERRPRKFPTLWVNPDVKNVEDFTMDDLRLEGYKPQKSIKLEMAV